jgi:beta-lactam-binding protein with PASTA domain
MPDLTGRSLEEAKDWAAQNSVQLDVRSEPLPAGAGADTVLKQDPPADTDITAATHVAVTIGG